MALFHTASEDEQRLLQTLFYAFYFKSHGPFARNVLVWINPHKTFTIAKGLQK